MKCSHCDGPVSVRSRTCGRCGAPQDITVRHRMELDAKLGEAFRRWLDLYAGRGHNETPYELATRQIEWLENMRRAMLAPVEISEDLGSRSYLYRGFKSHLTDFFNDHLGIVCLIAEVTGVLKDERFDLEHERVMTAQEAKR